MLLTLAVNFNRTIVELKPVEILDLHSGMYDFNRTIVELKQSILSYCGSSVPF